MDKKLFNMGSRGAGVDSLLWCINPSKKNTFFDNVLVNQDHLLPYNMFIS